MPLAPSGRPLVCCRSTSPVRYASSSSTVGAAVARALSGVSVRWALAKSIQVVVWLPPPMVTVSSSVPLTVPTKVMVSPGFSSASSSAGR